MSSTLNTFQEKLVAYVKKLARPIPVFDPSTLADDIALKTLWTPASRWSTNLCTHRFSRSDMYTVRFKVTVSALIFAGVFLVPGLVVALIPLYSLFVEGKSWQPMFLFPLCLGSIFIGVGVWMYRFLLLPIEFRKTSDSFICGRPKDPNRVVRLSDIYAIQLLRKIGSGKSSYYCYELNLVLRNAGRANVLTHGSLKYVREDAKQLSLFLGVPLWDAIPST